MIYERKHILFTFLYNFGECLIRGYFSKKNTLWLNFRKIALIIPSFEIYRVVKQKTSPLPNLSSKNLLLVTMKNLPLCSFTQILSCSYNKIYYGALPRLTNHMYLLLPYILWKMSLISFISQSFSHKSIYRIICR